MMASNKLSTTARKPLSCFVVQFEPNMALKRDLRVAARPCGPLAQRYVDYVDTAHFLSASDFGHFLSCWNVLLGVHVPNVNPARAQ